MPYRAMGHVVSCPIREGYPNSPHTPLQHCRRCPFYEGQNVAKMRVKCGCTTEMAMDVLKGRRNK